MALFQQVELTEADLRTAQAEARRLRAAAAAAFLGQLFGEQRPRPAVATDKATA